MGALRATEPERYAFVAARPLQLRAAEVHARGHGGLPAATRPLRVPGQPAAGDGLLLPHPGQVSGAAHRADRLRDRRVQARLPHRQTMRRRARLPRGAPALPVERVRSAPNVCLLVFNVPSVIF